MAKPVPTYTHAELVALAHRWLVGAGGCNFAFCEFSTLASWETPDALGYDPYGTTVLVECKTSRADFFADAKKPFRRKPADGLGAFRYFLVPAGLVRPDEIPARWGLIYAYEGERARGVVHPLRLPRSQREAFEWGLGERNTDGEHRILLAALRRVHLRGMWHVVQTPVDAPTDPDPRPLPEALEDVAEGVPA